MSQFTEDKQVEQPAIELFESIGWRVVDGYNEALGTANSDGTLGRYENTEAVLSVPLYRKLQELNPAVAEAQVQDAVKVLTQDRSASNYIRANKQIYDYLKDGVDITFQNEKNEQETKTLQIIDWRNPENNYFLLVSQFWLRSNYGRKRLDLTGFINGIPVLLFELKKPGEDVYKAYEGNLSDYKDTIPQLFWYNQAIILSNGAETKIGTISASWEHYFTWKKINDEEEEGIISLDTTIRGIGEKHRLLDILENFILFLNINKGKPAKLLALNHQYLGANNVVKAAQNTQQNQGKLGVFWHTQGSGKSFSMVFLTKKILRTVHGNWRFLIVTDRIDLDDQIYKNFNSAGVITEAESEVRIQNKDHLVQALKEDHKYLFSLVHKFHNRAKDKDGNPYKEEFPVISNDSNIIVITDEAHRSQYDDLAKNMRKALPNASLLAFTGTPLIQGSQERTKTEFGDYVSIYDFQQSIDDGATVPLYCENRAPELNLTNEYLNSEIAEVLDNATLNDKQEEKLEKEFAQQYHLITRIERLRKVAADVVAHFPERGFKGKAMFIAIDRFTAVRMYDLVQQEWEKAKSELKTKIDQATEENEQNYLIEKHSYMENTDMAVVISKSQNEIKDFDKKGLDVRPHRERMEHEKLDEKFKDPNDPLRLVFVCAMWITGFDAPPLSTLYLDKPMKNHTLMQTIARANRVFEDKENGLIVPYIGDFKENLKQALATYARGNRGNSEPPVKDKEELLEQLEQAVKDAKEYCQELGIDLHTIISSDGFQITAYQDQFAKAIVRFHELNKNVDDQTEAVLMDEERKSRFMSHVNLVDRIYRAVLPDPRASEYSDIRNALRAIQDRIKSLTPSGGYDNSIDLVRDKINDKLDKSIDATDYTIDPMAEYQQVNLSKLDIEKLKAQFDNSNHQRQETEKVKGQVQQKLEQMVEENRTRMDYKERFEQMIEEYNSPSVNLEDLFNQLINFLGELQEEDKRYMRENLDDEEQLAIFDLILSEKPGDLTQKQGDKIKKGVRQLLDTLKQEKLVIDWKKHQQTRAQVKVAIEEELDQILPENYDRKHFTQACSKVFDHVLQVY